MTTENDKIDPRLRKELERLERRGATAERVPVIIRPTADPPSSADTLDAMSRAAGETHAPVRERLAGMGVTDVQDMTLANALTTTLTPPQVRELAADPLIQRILWNIVERVTL
jgi:hypothetical protein